MSSREIADTAQGLTQIIKHNRTLDWVLRNQPQALKSPYQSQLLYGTLRHCLSLQRNVSGQLKKPIRDKDQVLESILLVGAYQLFRTERPAHAVVDECVDAARQVGRKSAAGLINAVLRNLPKENPDQTFGHPEWMIDQYRAHYPQSWLKLLEANNDRAPMTLRINTKKIAREDYIAQLEQAGVSAAPGLNSTAVILANPCKASELPGWHEGLVSVQDQGAQFVVELLLQHLSSKPSRLLDACAAPGGKLFHLLTELSKTEACVDALDIRQWRIEEMSANAKRLSLQDKYNSIVADARHGDWWSGDLYDAILIDAPCSGSGTLRRHPDIKLLANKAQLGDHAQRQLALLTNLWPMLRPQGVVLYCTCSVWPQENDEVINAFLANHQAEAKSLKLPIGQATTHGWQCLPTDKVTDGFYYSVIEKPGLSE